MSLRLKTILAAILLALFLFAGLYYISSSILLNSFVTLEKQYMLQLTDTVRYAIQEQIDEIDRTTSDWAAWDETYLFLQDANPTYQKRNLVTSTYENLNLSFIAILTREGKILYGEAYDPSTRERVALAAGIRQWLEKDPTTWRHIAPDHSLTGIIKLSESIFLVSSRPVVTSQYEGPIQGALVMGRLLTENSAQTIQQKMRLNALVHLRQPDPNRVSEAGWGDIRAEFAPTEIKAVNEAEVQSTRGVLDIHGNRAFVIELTATRDIYQYGRNTLNILLGGVLVISMLVGVFMVVLQNKAYVSRLMQLANQVGEIDVDGSDLPEISLHGKDELGILVQQINRMITNLRTSSAALKESEERYALATQAANDGIWDWNLREDTFYFSPRLKVLLGYPADSTVNTFSAWFEKVLPEDRDRLQADIFSHIAGKTPQLENQHRIRLADGSSRWLMVRGLALRQGKEAYRLAGSFTNITHQKQVEERLRHDAMHDPLTDLFNRSYMIDQLTRVIEVSKRNRNYQAAFLHIDLDRFKVINDSLGHEAGDQLLIMIADRMRRNLRPSDTIARFGGDEFGVLIEDIHDISDVTHAASRLQQQLCKPIEVCGQQVFTTCSIGIASTASRYQRAEDILRDADSAMYRAKANGKDRFEIFDAEMHALNMKRLTLETELHRALFNKEFCVYYQPVISVQDRRVVSFEALIRWQHPERGLVLPGHFIGVAEETGLSVPLNEWVIHTACTQLKSWQDLGYPINKIAVNLSARQLRDPELPDLIRNVLENTGLAATSLELEIPENATMEDLNQTITILDMLNQMGIGLSIDDFGTSYSSLAHLKRFAAETIKIDRTFIRNITENEDEASLASAIIAMAHILGKRVVAEGVENYRQLAFLEQQHCDEAQGFLFSKAVPPHQAEELLKNQMFVTLNPVACD